MGEFALKKKVHFEKKIPSLCKTLHNQLLGAIHKWCQHLLERGGAKDFWYFCEIYLQFIAPIDLWNKCIDLRLFLKCKGGLFLRTLRSKDDQRGFDQRYTYRVLQTIQMKLIHTFMWQRISLKTEINNP